MRDDQDDPAGGPQDADAGSPDDGTPPEPERTQPLTRPLGPPVGPEETQVVGYGTDPDRTRALGPQYPADPTRWQPSQPPAWSGRAGVPPRPATGPAEPVAWDEEYAVPGGRPWWTPIVIGLVALLFLGVLTVAIWLLIESNRRNASVEPSPSPTTATPSPTPTPSPAVTTGEPTPSATSAVPVFVPPLVGLSLPEAQDLLEELGLESRLEFRASGQPAGTVIDTEPGAGALVSPGDTVTLVVAQPRPSLPGTLSPAPTSTGFITASPG